MVETTLDCFFSKLKLTFRGLLNADWSIVHTARGCYCVLFRCRIIESWLHALPTSL